MSEPTPEQPVAGVNLWIEQGTSIHLRAVDESGDPIELATHEAQAVIDALQRLLDSLHELDGE